MDDLWDCLYTYVQEHCVPQHLWTPEHRQASALWEAALTALENMLSPEQQAAWEQFRTAEAALYAYEDMALFQEAIALGKWMAR